MGNSAPRRLRSHGRRLWRAVAGEFDLEPHESAILTRACRTADIIAALEERLAEDDALLVWRGETLAAHPALVELRLQTQLFARLLVALRVPVDDDGRPQYRGARGFYPRTVSGPWRRKPPPPPPPPPERLCRFAASEWPGDRLEARWRTWRAARADLAAEEDPSEEIPYLGDWLDRVEAEWSALLAAEGQVAS